ncbi:SCP2 sterol-binding domain-containing protein [Candidatus Erwinia haradaeae]|uniref:Ubiquinone biosynthesis protein UbiJ n=1 Tax=Candidatus Erwinia haradaeae TaxID=1922217 RepID=A0A451D935_9GAMM|nr:SCP2 sterol-binding domain-containing protein [Candidatus Erwinia haradaeae]VFP82224.1 Ubiquinone biosynthesis protein UbiJ [Candidatus Erwinia haradaeae]
MRLSTLYIVILEKFLTIILHYQKAPQAIQKSLKNKTISIDLFERIPPITLLFNEKEIFIFTDWTDITNCKITIHYTVFLKIHNYKNLIRLIQDGNLEIEGDIEVIQNICSLMYSIPKNQKKYIILLFYNLTKKIIHHLNNQLSHEIWHTIEYKKRYLFEILMEEWKLIPNPLEFVWFIKEMNALIYSLDALHKRTALLEEK